MAYNNTGFNTPKLNFDIDASGWITYLDTTTLAYPVDGIGGSPTITFARNATSPLTGLGDGLLTKAASNQKGQGVSYSFSVNRGVTNSVSNIQFIYETSANYVNGYMVVSILNVDTGLLINPSVVSLDATAGVPAKYSAIFTTGASLNYRLILHIATDTTTAWTFKIDTIAIGLRDISAAVGGGADEVFYENGKFVTADYTITANKNAMSAGPVTIQDGVSVTVPAGSVWTIV